MADYSEAGELGRVSAVPLSHISVEVGHFLMQDLVNGVDRIQKQFRRIVPLLDAFTRSAQDEFGDRARISTCFLVDDYFRPDTDPRVILDKILDTAHDCGLRIDYVAREAGCADVPEVVRDGIVRTPSIALAEMVRHRIVAEPYQGENGRRPPTAESGWLCNGKRATDQERGQALHPEQEYRPPEEFGRRGHSIFLDVEMWDHSNQGVDTPKWSCPYLAAIWQLLRLGMLRYEGRPPVEPQRNPERWPDRWEDLPSVIQIEPTAKPFAAYRSLSILPMRYVGIEHAVRVILDHIQLDHDVVEQVVERGRAENIAVSRRVAERLEHHLLAGS
ncbi:SCO2522 family protein [Nocardia carnea]|uniref:SCO2522 family protein n=1 Tax=Nocardia carnea TaxID=37328 RepID=A0ABW7TXN1_9NOCA|nr:SCO2522 family protein [Nocardia carnea]